MNEAKPKTLHDVKAVLSARRQELQQELHKKREMVVLMEANLVRARSESDVTFGALQATEGALATIEEAAAQNPNARAIS